MSATFYSNPYITRAQYSLHLWILLIKKTLSSFSFEKSLIQKESEHTMNEDSEYETFSAPQWPILRGTKGNGFKIVRKGLVWGRGHRDNEQAWISLNHPLNHRAPAARTAIHIWHSLVDSDRLHILEGFVVFLFFFPKAGQWHLRNCLMD